MLTQPPRDLPENLAPLAELAVDLRWTWSHQADFLWKRLDPEKWERTQNPWIILQSASTARLDELASDSDFVARIREFAEERHDYLGTRGWYGDAYPESPVSWIAYFSMEFGLGEALPLYAGGLGVLAGDYLKAASDLGLPVVGVGLLYQEGYFRQTIDAQGQQQEVYPFNEPANLPIQPVHGKEGGWLLIPLELPGRTLSLRVWKAMVGRVNLYLLDSNSPLNAAADRGITGKLYGGGQEIRLLQEIVLGIGGWRLLNEVGIKVDVCHLNEGHAAFVVLERAREFMQERNVSFWEALWATRAGNVLTTHTSVGAGFDLYGMALIQKYLPYFRDFLAETDLTLEQVLGLGRITAENDEEPFNMTNLALRGSATVYGVSRLHGEVSRKLFQPLFSRWPLAEVPIGHVTNGVHTPSWDSAWADELWSSACGQDRWRCPTETLADVMAETSDETIWSMCAKERQDFVDYVRARLTRHLAERGADPRSVANAEQVLDPNALTLCYARRFTGYKRPDLLLLDPERLLRILLNPQHPVQLVVAGKAHPDDTEGKRAIQRWIAFVQGSEARKHAAFLEDYDIAVAEQLVCGADLWLNTPRRPWEACGTSGMKILANGGLNISALDGWWDEAYAAEFGWAIGDRSTHTDHERDIREADQLYRILEEEIIPEFYDRDAEGIPRHWTARIRASMAELAPRYSSNRMVREYLERAYLPAVAGVAKRHADTGRLAKTLYAWEQQLRHGWAHIHFGDRRVEESANEWCFTIPAYLSDIDSDEIRVELYLDANDAGQEGGVWTMQRGNALAGAANGFLYSVCVPKTRSPHDYTARIVPYHKDARVPLELPLIHWEH